MIENPRAILSHNFTLLIAEVVVKGADNEATQLIWQMLDLERQHLLVKRGFIGTIGAGLEFEVGNGVDANHEAPTLSLSLSLSLPATRSTPSSGVKALVRQQRISSCVHLKTRGQWSYRPAATRAMKDGHVMKVDLCFEISNLHYLGIHVHIASNSHFGGL